MVASRAALATTGMAVSMAVYLGSNTLDMPLRAAIYSDAGDLIAQSAETLVPTVNAGWVTVAIPNTWLSTATYLLAALHPSGGSVAYEQGTTGDEAWMTWIYVSHPEGFPSAIRGAGKWEEPLLTPFVSIYCPGVYGHAHPYPDHYLYMDVVPDPHSRRRPLRLPGRPLSRRPRHRPSPRHRRDTPPRRCRAPRRKPRRTRPR
jgi:hypothetical protein